MSRMGTDKSVNWSKVTDWNRPIQKMFDELQSLSYLCPSVLLTIGFFARREEFIISIASRRLLSPEDGRERRTTDFTDFTDGHRSNQTRTGLFALPATTITAAMPKLAREGQRDVFLSDLCPSVKSVTSVFDSWFDLFSWVAGVPRWDICGQSPLSHVLLSRQPFGLGDVNHRQAARVPDLCPARDVPRHEQPLAAVVERGGVRSL